MIMKIITAIIIIVNISLAFAICQALIILYRLNNYFSKQPCAVGVFCYLCFSDKETEAQRLCRTCCCCTAHKWLRWNLNPVVWEEPFQFGEILSTISDQQQILKCNFESSLISNGKNRHEFCTNLIYTPAEKKRPTVFLRVQDRIVT